MTSQNQWHEVHIHPCGTDPDDIEIFINHMHPEDPLECDLSQYLANSEWDDLIDEGAGTYLCRMEDGVLHVCALELEDDVTPGLIDLTGETL